MRTIHIDVTDILRFAKSNAALTGVQRFVLQLISCLVNSQGADRVKLIAFHPWLKRLVSYDASYFGGDFQFDQVRFRHHFGLRPIGRLPIELETYVRRRYGNKWVYYHCGRLAIQNVLTKGQVYRGRNINISMRGLPAKQKAAEPRVNPGDIIFIGGASWGRKDLYKELARLQHRQEGVGIWHYIHDLIPLTSPEFVTRKSTENYGNWLGAIARKSSRLLTNSTASLAELETWLVKNNIPAEAHLVRLAHQFGNKPRDYAPCDEVQHHVRLTARVPYVLCVGTLTARKNIWTLASVWMQVLAKLGSGTPRLIFAGQHGGLKEDFDDFIRGTGSLYGYIRIIEQPSDEDLAYLYRNCLFSIYPSYKEGWGLPIGESLWFGRPVICSNVSSMPEVGGELAEYIDPYSPQSIEAAVIKLITDTEYREQRAAQIRSARLRTWADVADDIWRELNR